MGGKFRFQSFKKSYLAGEAVKCWVYLKLDAAVDVEKPITFEVIGYGKSEWIVHPNSPFSTGDGKSRRVVAEDPFWSASVNLAEPKVFDKGEHAYQAMIHLPSDLFPSFVFRDEPSGEEFSVRYVIRANLPSRDKTVEPLEKVIEIVSPRLDATTLDGLIVRDQAPSGTAVSISARRALWQPAHVATCFYHLTAPSQTEISGLDLELWQKVGLPGPKGNTDRVGIRRMVASYAIPGISSGKARSNTLKLDIPVLPPTIQLGPIDISYELCSVATFSGMTREEFCIAPVVLLPNIDLDIPAGYDDIDEFAIPNGPAPTVLTLAPTPLAPSTPEPGSGYPALPGTFPGSPNPNSFSPALPWSAPFPPPSPFPAFGVPPPPNAFYGPPGFIPPSPALPPQMAGFPPPSPALGPTGQPPVFQPPVLPSPGPSPAMSPNPVMHFGVPPGPLMYQGPPTLNPYNSMPPPGQETIAFGGVRPPPPPGPPPADGSLPLPAPPPPPPPLPADPTAAADSTSYSVGDDVQNGAAVASAEPTDEGATDSAARDEEQRKLQEEKNRANEEAKRKLQEERDKLAELKRTKELQRERELLELKAAADKELELQRVAAEKEKLARDKELQEQKFRLEKELEMAKKEMENERIRHQLAAEMEKVKFQADELRRQQEESERAKREADRLRKEIEELNKQKAQLASAAAVAPLSFSSLAATSSSPVQPAAAGGKEAGATATPAVATADAAKKPRSRLAEQVALAMANIPNRTVTTIKRQPTVTPVISAAGTEDPKGPTPSTTPSASTADPSRKLSTSPAKAPTISVSPSKVGDASAAPPVTQVEKPVVAAAAMAIAAAAPAQKPVTETEIKNAYEDTLDTYRARLLGYLTNNGVPAPGTDRKAMRHEEMKKAEVVIGRSPKAAMIMGALKESMKLVEKELEEAFEVAAYQSVTDRIKEGKIHLQNAIDAGVVTTIQELEAECTSFIESLKERTDATLPKRLWEKAIWFFEEEVRNPLIRRLHDRLGYVQDQLQKQLLKQQQYEFDHRATANIAAPPPAPPRRGPPEPLPPPNAGNPPAPMVSLTSRRSDEPNSFSNRQTAPIPAPPPGVIYHPPPPPPSIKKGPTQYVKPAPVPITVTIPPRYADQGPYIPPRSNTGNGSQPGNASNVGGGGAWRSAFDGPAIPVPENRRCLRSGCANNKAVGKPFCSSNCEVIYARQQSEAAARNKW